MVHGFSEFGLEVETLSSSLFEVCDDPGIDIAMVSLTTLHLTTLTMILNPKSYIHDRKMQKPFALLIRDL